MAEFKEETYMDRYVAEIKRLFDNDDPDWEKKLHQWVLDNPAPPMTGPPIIIKKMGT
jgi:alkanesulfonate monooxygenase SsuD/methylene tetrahydromethanopterin reductase-like flavin-dependent oxidoreductase (luciferase family)